MTDTTALSLSRHGEVDIRRPGRWCVAAGLVGIAQGAAILAWPRQVSDRRFSFPLTAGEHVVAQATFFLQHLPLVAAIAALAGLPAVRNTAPARRALVTAAIGLGLLAVMELVAMCAATTDNDSTLGTTISSLYAVPVLTTGIGLVAAAAVMLRKHIMGRHLPLCLLALGAFVFVGLTPVIATDSFVGGRLAIMAWMALFVALGVAMQRVHDE